MNQNINIKIMKKPELTDEEIRSYMLFDKLLEAYKTTSSRSANSPGKWFYIAAIAIVLSSAAIYFLSQEPIEADEHNKDSFQAHARDSSTQLKYHLIQPIPNAETHEKKTGSTMAKVAAKEKKNASLDTTTTKKLTPSQFIEAEPVEGYSALYEYFARELKYPVEAARDSIEGIVTVSFVINNEGKPEMIKIENSLGPTFDKECKRIINSMPLWKPAMINGKPISIRLSIPLTFKIKK